MTIIFDIQRSFSNNDNFFLVKYEYTISSYFTNCGLNNLAVHQRALYKHLFNKSETSKYPSNIHTYVHIQTCVCTYLCTYMYVCIYIQYIKCITRPSLSLSKQVKFQTWLAVITLLNVDGS